MRGEGKPVWDDLASAEDLAALSPPVPDRVPPSPDVLIVGGGAIGLSIAFFCELAGLDVVLKERGRLAGRASGRAAGGLAPDGHPELGDDWRALARESLALHRELSGECRYTLCSKDLLVLPDYRIREQGWVDPLQFCAALARRCETVVRDDTVQPRVTVYATGAAPGDTYVKGHLLATEPARFRFDEIYASLDDDLLMLQLADGRIVAGGTKEPEVAGRAVDDEVIERIHACVARIFGEAPPVTHRWTCFRPYAGSDRPVIGERDGAIVASGFYSTGILMAPIVGRLVSQWITTGARPPELEPFA